MCGEGMHFVSNTNVTSPCRESDHSKTDWDLAHGAIFAHYPHGIIRRSRQAHDARSVKACTEHTGTRNKIRN